jgi:hypothetical protein
MNRRKDNMSPPTRGSIAYKARKGRIRKEKAERNAPPRDNISDIKFTVAHLGKSAAWNCAIKHLDALEYMANNYRPPANLLVCVIHAFNLDALRFLLGKLDFSHSIRNDICSAAHEAESSSYPNKRAISLKAMKLMLKKVVENEGTSNSIAIINDIIDRACEFRHYETVKILDAWKSDFCLRNNMTFRLHPRNVPVVRAESPPERDLLDECMSNLMSRRPR